MCVSVCLHLLNSFNMGEVISSAGPVCAFQIAIQLFKLMNVFITNNVIRCSMFQQLFDILISSFHFFLCRLVLIAIAKLSLPKFTHPVTELNSIIMPPPFLFSVV